MTVTKTPRNATSLTHHHNIRVTWPNRKNRPASPEQRCVPEVHCSVQMFIIRTLKTRRRDLCRIMPLLLPGLHFSSQVAANTMTSRALSFWSCVGYVSLISWLHLRSWVKHQAWFRIVWKLKLCEVISSYRLRISTLHSTDAPVDTFIQRKKSLYWNLQMGFRERKKSLLLWN